MCRLVMYITGESDEFQEFLRALLWIAAVVLVRNRGKFDILKGTHPGREIEGLDYKPDLAAKMREFIVREFVHDISENANLSFGGIIAAADQVRERALA